jgi:hypothetical protein
MAQTNRPRRTPAAARSATRKTTPAAPPAARRRPFSRAADIATAAQCFRVRVPGLGEVGLPGRDAIVYATGLSLLAAFEIIEWPVAIAVAVGHSLAQGEHSRLLHDFGEALERA